jgi:hydrogenase maturation protease
MAKILVIGYGNPLRGDDSFGHRAVQKLREYVTLREVEFVECQQLMPEQAEAVSKAELVLFVDADMDGVAGTVHSRRIVPEIRKSDALVHHLDPGALLGLSKALYKRTPESMLMTVTGECFGYGAQLSTEVAKALPGVVQHMKEMIMEKCGELTHA